jgi:hypothetical protein
MRSIFASIFLCSFVASSHSFRSNSLSDFTRYNNTDITPCVPPCTRVGGCGNYAPNPNGPCNITWLAEQCSATYGCVAFNSNGWLKGCANVTACGASFESVSGTDSYVNTSSGGVPPPPLPCPDHIIPVEDVYYPVEEVAEAAIAFVPVVLSSGEDWAVLSPPAGTTGSPINVSVNDWAFNFQFLAVLPPSALSPNPLVVMERTFARWGFFVFVAQGAGEVARLRKGVGAANGLVMPRYSYLGDDKCGYYENVFNAPEDLIATWLLNETGGEASYLNAIKYLPPQRDYASFGGIDPYDKFSVSPDGRIKTADDSIYVPTDAVNETGGGVLVFDPATVIGSLGGQWPSTNYTFVKSALVGRFLRVIATVGYDYDSGFGFEQVAFAPASEPAASAYIRLRADEEGQTGAFGYFNASSKSATSSLDPTAFYAALFAESLLWNATFAAATAYSLPGREGARQQDTAAATLVASMSLYIGLQPNYGDGSTYWSPQIDRGGSLPFQEIAVVQNLLDIGLIDEAGQRLGWWLDNYLKPDGELSTGDWELSCPNGFADGLSDFGQMEDIFTRIARAQLSGNAVNGSAWLSAHIDQGVRLMNYSYHLRLSAVARGDTNETKGLIFGPPEHDTCHDPGYYYHNNAWFLRGMIEAGKFLRDVCPSFCPAYAPLGEIFLTEAAAFRADIEASLALSCTFDAHGVPTFVPPIARRGYAPFNSMIESTVAEYSNFRYFSELLGADILDRDYSIALQEFRETHQGTVSGITRWSDHLDDMPSSYYLAASLRDDRIPRFLLLQYGHMANYMVRSRREPPLELQIAD